MLDPPVIGRPTAAARRFLRLGPRAEKIATSALAWLLAAQVAMHLAGIGWGLPASDGWDNDGVAPRDFLAGIVATFVPGQYFRYPPVHLALLTALTSPVAAVALARARSLAAADVVREIIAVPYMTLFALLARAVSIAMAAGVVWALAKTAEELRGKAAGSWTAAFAGAAVPLVYYGQTSNLDVPYLFWGCLAVLAVVRAIARRDPGRVRRAAILAALAVGTKDQAYALFLVSVPVCIGIWAASDRPLWTETRTRATVLRAGILGLATLLVIDGPLYNPRGFLHRMAFLAGPASAPFAPYSDDVAGRLAALADVVERVGSVYPAAFVVAIGAGLFVLARDCVRDRRLCAASVLPLLVALSFTLAFNGVARRADHRFVLPQVAMLGVYGGVGVEALWSTIRPTLLRWAARAAVVGALAQAVFSAVGVEVNVRDDPRYDAEAWLRSHTAAGDHVETYGLNAYLPRFPPAVHVDRVGAEPAERRSPLPGVCEVVAPLGEVRVRAPRLLVVAEAYAGRFFVAPPRSAARGRALAATQAESAADPDAAGFFRALRVDPEGLGYRLVHTSRWDHPWWPALDIHASTARSVAIYERIE